MNPLYAIFIDPFAQMLSAPDLFAQTIWEGFVGGVLYSLIALGFVLIYKASGVFNFAQGIMMVFAALTLVGLHEKGLPAWIALALTVAVMYGLAFGVERLVLRPLVNQADIILLMATFGLTYFLIGFGAVRVRRQPETDDNNRTRSAERRHRSAYPRRHGHAAKARHRRGGDRHHHGGGARRCSSRRPASGGR